MDTPAAESHTVNFMTQTGDQIEVKCAGSDSILKLKHRLFIVKDLPVDRQVIIKMGKQLADDLLVKDLNLTEGQALQVNLQDKHVSSSNGMYDIVRENDECFLRYKDESGSYVYRQFGSLKADDEEQLNFKDQPTPQMKDLLLKDKLFFFRLPANYKEATLTLKSHAGQALCLSSKTFKHEGVDVYFFDLGPKEKAMKVYFVHNEFGDYIKLAHKLGHQFDCAEGKYHEGNQVVVYKDHNGGNQWFVINDNRTISPCLSPHMVFAFQQGKLVLKKKGGQGELVFDDLQPSFQPTHYMKMTLQSHPGKGIVFTGEERQHEHGQEEMIALGNADDAESIFIDDGGFVHSKSRPSTVFDGYEHENRDLEFFPMHSEYDHQQFSINQDGTISMKHNPEWVLGTDDAVKRVKFVKRGNENQFIFDEATTYLSGNSTPSGETAGGP